MNVDETIEKVFGSDRCDKDRFQKKIEKSPFINLNMDFYSNRKKDKLLKNQKINISSFQKQFTNFENRFEKKSQKKSSGHIDLNNYNELKSHQNENENEKEKEKSNKIKNIKSNIYPVSKESKSTKNIIHLKYVSVFNKNEETKNNNEKKNNLEKKNHNIEKKNTNEKKISKIKKKKEALNINNNLNNNNLNYMIQKVSLMEKRNIFDEVQRAIQFEIKSKKSSNRDLIIETIRMPNYCIIQNEGKDNNIINESKKIKSNIVKDNTNESGNNFKTIYNVNNKKHNFLCCM